MEGGGGFWISWIAQRESVWITTERNLCSAAIMMEAPIATSSVCKVDAWSKSLLAIGNFALLTNLIFYILVHAHTLAPNILQHLKAIRFTLTFVFIPEPWRFTLLTNLFSYMYTHTLTFNIISLHLKGLFIFIFLFIIEPQRFTFLTDSCILKHSHLTIFYYTKGQ